jgi:hypothetical protein
LKKGKEEKTKKSQNEAKQTKKTFTGNRFGKNLNNLLGYQLNIAGRSEVNIAAGKFKAVEYQQGSIHLKVCLHFIRSDF